MSCMRSEYKQSLSVLNIMVAFFFLTTPLESVSLFDKFSLAKLSSILVLIIWVIKGFKIRKSNIVRAYIFVSLVAILSVMWSIDKEHTILSILNFLIPCIILSEAILVSIKDKKTIELYMFSYVIGCFIISLSCIINREAIIENAILNDEMRLTTFDQNQNVLAFLLTMGLVIMLSFIRKQKVMIVRMIEWVLVIFFSFVSISTGSRMGMTLMCVVFLLFLISSKNKEQGIALIFFMGSFILFLIPLIPDVVFNRLLETGTLIGSGNFSGRGAIWERAWNAYMYENPLLGVGYGNFVTLLEQYYSSAGASHNSYLTFIIEFGFLLSWIFFVPIIMILKYAYSLSRKLKDFYVFAYVLPLFIAMFVLETERNRWIYVIGIMVYAWYELEFKKEKIGATHEDI